MSISCWPTSSIYTGGVPSPLSFTWSVPPTSTYSADCSFLVSSVNNSGASPSLNSSSLSLNLTVVGLSSTYPMVTLAAAPPNGTKLMLSVCCQGQSVCISSPQLLMVPQDCTSSFLPYPLQPPPPPSYLPPGVSLTAFCCRKDI